MPEKPLFGYKMHLAVDQGSGLVRRAILTPGHVSDKSPFLDLVQGDEQAVYADKGYDGAWYRAATGRAGHRRWRHGRQLPAAAARCRGPRPQPRNRGDPRAGRTHLRAPQALVRLRRVRYRSLLKNALQLQLLAVALNLRRALVLTIPPPWGGGGNAVRPQPLSTRRGAG